MARIVMIIFEVGKSYNNNNGDYVVLDIQHDVMKVRYLNGQEQVLSIAMQTRICENRNLTQTTEQTHFTRQQKGYQAYWTLGFLAHRIIRLGANIITEKEGEFRDEYQLTTGRELQRDQVGISFLREGANQWGNQGVFAFYAEEHELALLNFRNTPYPTNMSHIFEVKDINFFWFALGHGFQIGNKQDTVAIQDTIPSMNRDSFNKGYEYAKSCNAVLNECSTSPIPPEDLLPKQD